MTKVGFGVSQLMKQRKQELLGIAESVDRRRQKGRCNLAASGEGMSFSRICSYG